MEYIVLVVLGLAAGSFINALVWRLHEQEARSSELEARGKSKKISDDAISKKNKEMSILQGRSMCPNCKHTLSAKDLIPVISWLQLRGRCRYCKKSIHWQYPVVEVVTSGAFVLNGLFWSPNIQQLVVNINFQLLEFSFWLLFLTALVALFVYDLKWMLLPNRIVYPLITGATILRVIEIIDGADLGTVVLDAVFGSLVLGGLFYLLFQLSGGRWIGGGDVKLGIFIGILVGPILAYFVLLLSSIIGSVISIALILCKKAKRSQAVPFGPFLIIATYIAVVWGQQIIDWYDREFLGII